MSRLNGKLPDESRFEFALRLTKALKDNEAHVIRTDGELMYVDSKSVLDIVYGEIEYEAESWREEYDEEEEIELTADAVALAEARLAALRPIVTADASAVEDEFNEIAVYPDDAVKVQQDRGERVHVPYTGSTLDKVFGPGGCK